MSLVDVAAWGIVLWDWGCGTKNFRCLGVFREKASLGMRPFDKVVASKLGLFAKMTPKNVFENWYPSVFFGDPNT